MQIYKKNYLLSLYPYGTFPTLQLTKKLFYRIFYIGCDIIDGPQ